MTWRSPWEEVRTIGVQDPCIHTCAKLWHGWELGERVAWSCTRLEGEERRAYLRHMASGSAKCLEYFQFSSGWEDLEGRLFISCFLCWRSQPWGVYGCVRSVDVTRMCIYANLYEWPRLYAYVVCTSSYKSYLRHRTASKGKEEVMLCSLSSVVLWRISATFNTQTRQSLGTSPDCMETSIRTLLSVVLNVSAH